LKRLDLLLVLVELGVRIDLDPHFAAGIFLDKFLEPERALALRRVVGDDVAELDDDRLLCPTRTAVRSRQNRSCSGRAELSSGESHNGVLCWREGVIVVGRPTCRSGGVRGQHHIKAGIWQLAVGVASVSPRARSTRRMAEVAGLQPGVKPCD